MNYYEAITAVNQFKHPRLAALRRIHPYTVTFVSPAVSVALAAARLHDEAVENCQFSASCSGYAAASGLVDAIAGRPLENKRGGSQGVTYSRLTHLRSHNDVEFCNAVIGDLMYGQLWANDNARFVQAVVKVVGELHDNVASHAGGAGFSSAQVYDRQGKKCIEFAVADAGCGFLRNVERVTKNATSDSQAIEWCLARGNTTAAPRDDMAQRLPDDVLVSPLPRGVPSFAQEDHHMGEGLWKLTELVDCCSGSLFIWSGNAKLTILNGTRSHGLPILPWKGVMIEMELPVESFRAATTDERNIEALGRRLGI